LTPELQNTFEAHLKAGFPASRGSRRPTSSSFAMTIDERGAAGYLNSNLISKEGRREIDSASWPTTGKPVQPLSYPPFHLQESQETIIATLIHKNMQLKKTIQKLTTTLKQIQGMDTQNGQL